MNSYWPHFKNIHYQVANNPIEIFDTNVCITEKLDGSNLTIYIHNYNNNIDKKSKKIPKQ